MADQHWQLEGTLAQLIYSPRGTIEGLLLDVDGAVAQFVVDKHDTHLPQHLKAGQPLTLIGTLRKPSPKGEAEHEVYDLVEIVGNEHEAEKELSGKVARLNYAKHGEPNGVVLESGDFIHTKPDGLRKLGWKVGDAIKAKGRVQALATGAGYVLEFQPQ